MIEQFQTGRMGRGRARAAGALLLACGSVLAGCAAEVPRRNAGVFAGDQSRSAELVFSGPEVLAWGADEGAPEYARRDAALGSVRGRDAMEGVLFPEEPQPSLAYLRRAIIETTNADVVHYYRRDLLEYARSRPVYPRRWR